MTKPPRALHILRDTGATAFGVLAGLWLFIEVATYFHLPIAETFRVLDGWGYALLILLSSVVALAYAVYRCLLLLKEAVNGDAVRQVRFWNSIVERQASDLDVRGLLSGSKKYVFLSSISMNYVAHSCSAELRRALARGVAVDVMMAMNDESKKFYERYCDVDLIAVSQRRYKAFFDSLPDTERRLLKVYASRVPLTHSIGQYDDEIFVSEFCIDTDSALVPSYRLAPSDSAYAVFKKEIQILKKESVCIVGRYT